MAPAKGRRKAKEEPPPNIQPATTKRVTKKSVQETLNSSSEEEALATSKDNTQPKRNKAKVVLSPREQRQVQRVSRSYIDEEAEEDDEIEASEEEEEADKAFIDDRDEEELTDTEATDTETKGDKENADEVEEEEEEEAQELEEKPVTPPPAQRRRRVVQSPLEPQTPRATRSKPATGGTPKTPPTTRKKPQSKKKSSKQTDGNDSDVVEIAKPSDSPSTKPKSKGKSHASVTLLDAPIKMPATKSQILSEPIADPEYNPFVTVSGDEMEIDELVEDDVHSSPRKKIKTLSGEAKAAKASPAKKKKEHDPVTDTPVTGMSKKMAKSFIASDDEDNMTPEPETSTSLEMVSNPDNPEHARFMCKYMKPSYRAPHAPPLITVAHTVLLCPDHDNTPLSFVNFGEAMRAVGIKKNSKLWTRLWMVAITPAFGPFTYNLARIDPNIVRTHTTRGQWPTVTFSIQENISSHKEWSANAPVSFVMFGMVTKSHLVDPDPFGQKWQRCIFIRLLGMEFLRVMNILASKFQLKKISTPRWEGFRFGTTPTIRRDNQPRSPRKRRKADDGSSEELDIDIPSASIGGRAIQRASPVKARAEIQSLAGRGKMFNTDKIPVYDYTDVVDDEELPMFNQETLVGARVWTGGEIPEDSWVCVHYVPSTYTHESHSHVDVQWNVLRIVVLALPKDD